MTEALPTPGVTEVPTPAPTAPVEVIDATPKVPKVLGAPPPRETLLEVRDLRTVFHVMDGDVPAVDGVSFSLGRGKTLGIVGESGSGKSVTALTIMRLLDIPPAEIASGEIWFDGREVLSMPMDEMRKIRGKDMAMIFQEPLTSLNPVFTIGDQIAEQVQLHLKTTKKEAWDRAIEALTLVGIPSPERRVKQYPHEMSGGMRQRVMIAMGLSCEPKLLIADEPTTALDVTIQAQILELLKSIQERTDSALLLITHDLGVVAEMVDHVIVMYAGQIVEQGTVDQVLISPKAPYTMGLLESIPTAEKRGARLEVIKGVVPSPFNLPPACRFEPRCPYAWEACHEIVPPLVPARDGGGQTARCHLETEIGAGRRAEAHAAHDRALDPQHVDALTGGME
jgi:peptide/nickel transport system ATP-binding protein